MIIILLRWSDWWSYRFFVHIILCLPELILLLQQRDDFVDGLLVASVTSYKFERRAPNLVDIFHHNGNMDRSNVFMALQDIYPTRIAKIPFGDNGFPIKITRNGINNTRIVNAYGQQLSYSYMLLIDPDKISRMPEKRPYTLLYLSSSCTSDNKTNIFVCTSE